MIHDERLVRRTLTISAYLGLLEERHGGADVATGIPTNPTCSRKAAGTRCSSHAWEPSVRERRTSVMTAVNDRGGD